MKYETTLKDIKSEWSELKLNVIPYKKSNDAYILVDHELITNIIEDHLTTLESVQ